MVLSMIRGLIFELLGFYFDDYIFNLLFLLLCLKFWDLLV